MKPRPANPRPSARPAPAGRAAGVPADSPPSVIRGANSQPTVCIDWLRLSGPSSQLVKARRILEAAFGPLAPGKGRFPLLDLGEHIGAGGLFCSSEPRVDHCIVDLPGSLLRELQPAAIHALADALLWLGFKATRCDIALDYTDQPDLIERATTSAQLGELCHCRRWEPKVVWSGGKLVGHGVNFGARGKLGSGRYLRIYDKGLEQQTHEPAQWIRWEAEFSGDVAAAVLREVLSSADPVFSMVSLAFGVVDFRTNTGDPNLSRRPRVPWFSDLLGSYQPARFRQERPGSTPAGYTRWVYRCVLPKLRTLAAATDQPLDNLAESLAPPVPPTLDHLTDRVVRGVLTELAIPLDQARSRVWKAVQRV